MAEGVIPWRPVRAPTPVNGDVRQVLASVDSLQRAWSDVINLSAPEEFQEARRRSLRRHAIETGIIERLYEVDWGVTEALVAEGLSAEVAAREGGIEENALETIKAQFDALTFLSDAVNEGRPLSTSFIRELHVALCRTQATYTARDQFGRLTERPLRHGSWKELPNRAETRDGRIVEFTPPEHVESEIEHLLQLEAGSRDLHPVVRAAWLHYAFVSIHPFDDGNGRVARALALLVLLQARYAPLVVDRYSRADYLDALSAANTDDLRDLVRLFARLEMVALRAELERPTVPQTTKSGAVDVARAYVERIRARRELDAADRARAVAELALTTNARVEARLRTLGQELAEQFRALDANAEAVVFVAAPPGEKALWWRAQVVRAASGAGFFVNLTEGTWWSILRITTLGLQLRYGVVTQKVGRGETGVLAVTVFAESVPTIHDGPGDGSPSFTPLLSAAETDSVTLVHGDDLEARWPEISDILDETLAAAVAAFAENLS